MLLTFLPVIVLAPLRVKSVLLKRGRRGKKIGYTPALRERYRRSAEYYAMNGHLVLSNDEGEVAEEWVVIKLFESLAQVLPVEGALERVLPSGFQCRVRSFSRT